MTHAELVEDVKAINKYPGTVQALYSAKSTLTATGHYLQAGRCRMEEWKMGEKTGTT